MDARPGYRLDTRGALGVVTGSMVGVGIFLAPAEMARAISAPGWFLAVWVLAALGAASGAAAYSALGTWRPRSGGDVVFLREAFGDGVAFAAGQVQFFAIFCGSAAVIAAALGQYQLASLTGWDLGVVLVDVPVLGGITWARILGAAVVLGLTATQSRGLRVADRVQRALALFPVLALSLLAIGTVVAALMGTLPPPTAAAAPVVPSVGALVTAWLAAHFAYSGWNAVIYLAGEVDAPERTLWRSMVGGTIAVAALYLLICGAFLMGLGMGGLAEAGEAGTALATRVAGPTAGRWMNGLIAIGLVGTTHATLLGGARVAQVMAAHGELPAVFARTDNLHTPTPALWLQGAWTALLVLGAGADALLSGVALAMVVIGTMTVLSLFVLRLRLGTSGPGTPLQLALASVHLVVGLGIVAVEVHRAIDEGQASALGGLGAMLLLVVVGSLLKRRRDAVRVGAHDAASADVVQGPE